MVGLGMVVKLTERGVVVGSIDRASVAGAADPFIKVGDRVISIDGVKVSTEQDAKALALGSAGSRVTLHCSRDAPLLLSSSREAHHALALGSSPTASASASPGAGASRSRRVSVLALVRGHPGMHTVLSNRVAQQMGDASSEADTLPGQLLPGQNATFPRHQMLGASGGRPAPPLLSPAPPLLSPARSLLSPHTPSPGQARGARRGAPVPEREVLWRGRGVAVLEGFFKGRHGTVFSILGDDVVVSLECGPRTFPRGLLQTLSVQLVQDVPGLQDGNHAHTSPPPEQRPQHSSFPPPRDGGGMARCTSADAASRPWSAEKGPQEGCEDGWGDETWSIPSPPSDVPPRALATGEPCGGGARRTSGDDGGGSNGVGDVGSLLTPLHRPARAAGGRGEGWHSAREPRAGGAGDAAKAQGNTVVEDWMRGMGASVDIGRGDVPGEADRGSINGGGGGEGGALDDNLGEGLDGEVVFEELQLMVPPIGTGSHKTVYEGVWRGRRVAALQVRAAGPEVAREVAILRTLRGHPGLPAFYGVSRDESRRVWLIAELFTLGGLDSQLEAWAGQLSVAVRLCLGQQIAEAMAAIHSRGILHRDLATRNILVHSLSADSAAEVWVKVTDFGFARPGEVFHEEIKHDSAVPWRWTAPEVWRDSTWSRKSDVWAFGVALWEIFTDALIPYGEMSEDARVRQAVFDEGHRLACPPACPLATYVVMQECWAHSQHDRPDFASLTASLQVLANQGSPTKLEQEAAQSKRPFFVL
ncbi:tyrosine kinase-domain-containing protein [Baffinella frigidus]|nr:tyrosine kinase-domain-containing protein [Cryptophyta sp. CCMP2293]